MAPAPRSILLLLLVTSSSALLPGGCGQAPRGDGAGRPAPTWLALGHERYRHEEALEAQQEPLELVDEPRWFDGLEGPPPEPPRLAGLPRNDRGARLELEVRTPPEDDLVELRLTLHAGERPLWRETEHRWTNATPFLFGLYADGRPLRRRLEGAAKMGGIEGFVELVPAGGSRAWILRVERASIEALLGETAGKTLEIVAAFSERQHSVFAVMAREGYTVPLREAPQPPFDGAPILVRSRVVPLPW